MQFSPGDKNPFHAVTLRIHMHCLLLQQQQKVSYHSNFSCLACPEKLERVHPTEPKGESPFCP
uniref:Uncharacterized protein MANES_04G090300 n=1 Tax=Rhizophora mucronata TaxID=61149 RepID=A0A2P2NII3_RHIMU